MNRLRISYSLTRHLGQSRQAAVYMDILGEDHDLVNTQNDADIVIVHHPPRNYGTVYALHPALAERYVISCSVPHAEGIPTGWRRNLAKVQEVWTPSQFAYEVLAPHHPNVQVVPYVIERDTTASPVAQAYLRRLIEHAPDLVYFLTVGPLGEPRKNILGLVKTFLKVSPSMPKARLVIKGAPADQPFWSNHPQVFFLPLQMPFEYVTALYQLANVYISPHHAEAWGLATSDAMLFGKPIIATNYSGNLEYMTADNSYLLGWRSGGVHDLARPGSDLEPSMAWADPDLDHLADLMLHLYLVHEQPEARQKCAQAQIDVLRFQRQFAARSIRARLAEITRKLGR